MVDPVDGYARLDAQLPVIVAMWHGQHFLGPVAKRTGDRGKVLISRHRDGEINAIAAARLGIDLIRGSGDHGLEFNRKGGVSAFREMLDCLEQGGSVGLTADVPKVARVAGLGIVMLARASGRPIFPIALATRRRLVLNNWDRTTINLPLSRGARRWETDHRCRRMPTIAMRTSSAAGSRPRSMPRPHAPMRSPMARETRVLSGCRGRCTPIGGLPPRRPRSWPAVMASRLRQGKEHPERPRRAARRKARSRGPTGR